MKVYIKRLASCIQRNEKIQQYRNFLLSHGHKIVKNPSESDVIIIWTCAFRTDARDNSLQYIQQMENEYKNKVIAVGCLPDIDPLNLGLSYSGKSIGWREEQKLFSLFSSENSNNPVGRPVYIEPPVCDDIEAYKRNNKSADLHFYDQFIKMVVCEGCPYNCSYCTERLTFPKFRSFPLNEIIQASSEIIKKTSCRTFAILGDCTGEYGNDIGSSIIQLIGKICSLDDTINIALSNFNIKNYMDYFDDFNSLIRKEKIFHINLPIQSGSDRILQQMKRPYSVSDVIAVFKSFKDLGFNSFDTHIIVGFPGETDDDFNKTIELLLFFKPKYVLISAYLETVKVTSYNYENKVSQEVIDERILKAVSIFSENNIICNYEGSELIHSRFARLKSDDRCSCEKK